MCRQIIILLLCCAAITGCAAGAAKSKLIGHQHPPFTRFYLLDAEPVILEHFKGRNVVVLFWATTCNQSHRVIDDLNAYIARHGRQKNVIGIAVSIDEMKDLPKLRERIKWGKLDALKHSFSGNDIYDQAKIAFGVDTLPSLFVINPQGVVVAGGSSMDVVEDALGR